MQAENAKNGEKSPEKEGNPEQNGNEERTTRRSDEKQPEPLSKRSGNAPETDVRNAGRRKNGTIAERG